jgi:DNA-directed RNA polymerase subunit M/transcription elongation factor TFIIS
MAPALLPVIHLPSQGVVVNTTRLTTCDKKKRRKSKMPKKTQTKKVPKVRKAKKKTTTTTQRNKRQKVTNEAILETNLGLDELSFFKTVETTRNHIEQDALLAAMGQRSTEIETIDDGCNLLQLSDDDHKLLRSIKPDAKPPQRVRSIVPCINTACSNPDVTHVEMQLRSGDEGSSVMFACLSCHRQWSCI